MDDSFLLAGDNTYRCRAFEQFDGLAHGFGTRRANPPTDVTLRQIHSGIVLNAHGLTDRAREGDGLVTGEIGLKIGVRTADCVPILLFDSKQHSVAAVHAGWRGSAAEIIKRAIEQMSAGNVWAAVGPCIRECCYEVGPEVWSQFHPEANPRGKRKLNLAAVNIRQLKDAGVPDEQIFDSQLCTFCLAEQFYSFRREPGDPGRMLSAIARLA